MKTSVLNKEGNFGVKILWRYTDMAIFVLRCFILTHPVQSAAADDDVFHFCFTWPIFQSYFAEPQTTVLDQASRMW